MTEAEVLKLIAGGESMTVEFKGEEKKPLNDTKLIEAVVCMANAEGGYILIGMEDDGRVTGACPDHQDAAGAAGLISNRTVPSASVEVNTAVVKDLVLLIIEVKQSPFPIGTSTGKYLRRVIGGDGKPSCRPFFHYEIASHLASHTQADYSSLIVPGAYKAMGEKASYVRTRDVEALRHPEMVLQFAEKYGKVTRGDVVDLLNLKEPQASYLLRKLVEKSRLILMGKGRNAHYVPAGKSRTEKLAKQVPTEKNIEKT